MDILNLRYIFRTELFCRKKLIVTIKVQLIFLNSLANRLNLREQTAEKNGSDDKTGPPDGNFERLGS